VPTRGLIKAGNIDMRTRPKVRNADGSISTIRTFTVQNPQGQTVLYPAVTDDGRILSRPEALRYWASRGQNLGVFDSEANANAYDSMMHDQLTQQYAAMGWFTPGVTTGKGRRTVSGSKNLWTAPSGRDLTPSAVGLPDVGRAVAPRPGGATGSWAGAPTAPQSALESLESRAGAWFRRTFGGGGPPVLGMAFTPPSRPTPTAQAAPAPGPTIRDVGRMVRPQEPPTAPAPKPFLSWSDYTRALAAGQSDAVLRAQYQILNPGQAPFQRPRQPEPFPINPASVRPGSHEDRIVARARDIAPRWHRLSAADRLRFGRMLGPAVAGWLDRNAP
jgi:hypothetical protein